MDKKKAVLWNVHCLNCSSGTWMCRCEIFEECLQTCWHRQHSKMSAPSVLSTKVTTASIFGGTAASSASRLHKFKTSQMRKLQCKSCACIVCVHLESVCVDVMFPSPVEHTMHEYTHSYLTFRTLIHYSQSVDKALISTTHTFLKKNTASLCR